MISHKKKLVYMTLRAILMNTFEINQNYFGKI